MTPAFVSLLCICIVFVPMFFLHGVARFLFVPMAEAVMFAMIWSFILSRTLVPTMAKYLLQPHVHHAEQATAAAVAQSAGAVPARLRGAASSASARGYRELLTLAMQRRPVFVIGFLAAGRGCRSLLVPFLGRNFFPSVDAGQILMHVRTPGRHPRRGNRQPVRRRRRRRSARSFRPTRSRRWPTTSACRSAAST